MNPTALAGAGSEDPALGLRAVVSLHHLAEQLESLHVDRARELGWSWARIAAELGVSKQAVHQKHGRGRVSARGQVSTREKE
jgi:hypothetical protein